MKTSAKSRGQMLIIALIVLVLIVVIIVLGVASLGKRQNPIVLEALWQKNDQRITEANRGDELHAYVVVRAEEEYVGSILVKVRKDIALWIDTDYEFSTFPVNLRGGQTTELELSFIPDQASSGRLRGYFVEVDFQVTGSNWVMEDSYPPRLKIVD